MKKTKKTSFAGNNVWFFLRLMHDSIKDTRPSLH